MAHKTLSALCLLYLLSCACLASACDPCKMSPPPQPTPTPTYCPKDTLKLGVCADVLGLVNLAFGSQPKSKCCELLEGLVDLQAAVCLCTAIKANVLGVLKLDVPVALTLLVNACGKQVPDGFKCA